MDAKIVHDKSIFRDVDGFQYLYYDMLSHREVLAVFDDTGKPIGILVYVEKSFLSPLAFGVAYVSVHKDYKGTGIGKILVEKLFQLAKKQEKKIRPGYYEREGLLYIKHMFDRLSVQYGVELVNV